MSDCWDKSETAMLFEVAVGSVTFWVSSGTGPLAALETLLDGEGVVETIGDDMRLSIDVKPLSRREAAGHLFTTETEESTILAEFDHDPGPRVIACSEWVV